MLCELFLQLHSLCQGWAHRLRLKGLEILREFEGRRTEMFASLFSSRFRLRMTEPALLDFVRYLRFLPLLEKASDFSAFSPACISLETNSLC